MQIPPRRLTTAAALLLALVAAAMVPATTHAGPPNKCSAAKMKCVAKKVGALLRCYEKAQKNGLEPATDVKTRQCLQKAMDQFDGGAVPAKSCFGKAEAKEKASKPATICPTTDDTAMLEAKADVFVADVLTDLDPSFVPSPRFEDTGLTVVDHATGLQWEKKTEDGSVHDLGNFYELSDPSDGDLTDPDGSAFTEFLGMLNDCTTTDGRTVSGGFAGHCDWRLPQVSELLTILDLGAAGCGTGSPCINPSFGPTAADGHWSATTIAGNPTHARGLNFEQGSIGFGEKDDDLVVRAVRGGP